jgi:hypothetical protein
MRVCEGEVIEEVWGDREGVGRERERGGGRGRKRREGRGEGVQMIDWSVNLHVLI